MTPCNKCINFTTSLHNPLIIATFSVKIFSRRECLLSPSHNSRLMADSLIVAQHMSRVCVCLLRVRLCKCLFGFATVCVCVYALMSGLREWVMAMQSYGLAILLSWHLLHASGLSRCRTSHHIEIRALLDLLCNILTCLDVAAVAFSKQSREEEGWSWLLTSVGKTNGPLLWRTPLSLETI